MAQKPDLGLIQVVDFDPTQGAGVPGVPWQFLFRSDTSSMYIKSGGGNTDWTAVTSRSISDFYTTWYGTGIDGDFDYSTNQVFTRNVFFDNLNVQDGVSIDANGFVISVRGRLTLGTGALIHSRGGDGGNGTSTTGGVAGAATSTIGALGGSGAGGAGGNANADGSNAAAVSNGNPSRVNPTNVGGVGGAGGARTGGNGGVITNLAAVNGDIKQILTGVQARARATSITIRSGSGGGGGGGSTAADGGGGGGGGGGGYLVVCAREIVGDGLISVRGGNGGDAYVSSVNGAGGGGGGGGGNLVVVTQSLAADFAGYEYSGGDPGQSFGAGAGAAVAGSEGVFLIANG